MKIYASDWDDALPPASVWPGATEHYGRGRTDFHGFEYLADGDKVTHQRRGEPVGRLEGPDGTATILPDLSLDWEEQS